MALPMIYVERRHDALMPHQKFSGAWEPEILQRFINSMALSLFVSGSQTLRKLRSASSDI